MFGPTLISVTCVMGEEKRPSIICIINYSDIDELLVTTWRPYSKAIVM